MKKQNIIFSIIWIVLGLGFFICGAIDMIDDFWSGFGGGLFVIGILQMIRYLRYRTDQEYRENFDINVTDERNQFLAGRHGLPLPMCFFFLHHLQLSFLVLSEKIL